MKKLLQGIVEFQKKIQPDYKETFAKLALGQSPDALFICCSDSRVAPNVFASTDPGDLFVIRNVGNLIPSCGKDGLSKSDESEAAAIEFAVNNLKVKDIIICGHSECGAIQALLEGREKILSPNLRAWLRHAEASLKGKIQERLSKWPKEVHNQISQINVLEQMNHVMTYPAVVEKIKSGHLKVHAWWFELSTASVYAYDSSIKQFVLINEAEVKRILSLDQSSLQQIEPQNR